MYNFRFINRGNKMKNYFLLLFYLFFVKSLMITNNNKKISSDELFLNIMYRAIKRSSTTLKYLSFFNKYFKTQQELHHLVISRFKNPTKKSSETIEKYHDFILLYESYQDMINEVIFNNDQYQYIVNYLSLFLDNNDKDQFDLCKKKISVNVFKKIISIKTILELISNIVVEFNTLNKNALYGMKDKLSDVFKFLFDKANMYKNMFNIYNQIDANLLRYDLYIQNINIFFYTQYEKVWYIIEQERLTELCNLYKMKMNEYIERNKSLPKIILMNYDGSFIFEDALLPEYFDLNSTL